MVDMRILLASDQYWPMISGVATAGRTLVQGLVERGHEVMVVAPSQAGGGDHEIDTNYQIVRMRSLPLPFHQNLRVSISSQNAVRKTMAEFQPDIVHVHTQFTVGLTALYAAKKL